MSFSTRVVCWNVASASKKGGPLQVAQASSFRESLFAVDRVIKGFATFWCSAHVRIVPSQEKVVAGVARYTFEATVGLLAQECRLRLKRP